MGDAARDLLFLPQDQLTIDGKWQQSYLVTLRGQWNSTRLSMMPKALAVLKHLPDIQAAQVTNLGPGAVVKPHCGSNAARIRLHLTLRSQPGCCVLRVLGQDRILEPGRVHAFDDAYEHEAWYSSGSG